MKCGEIYKKHTLIRALPILALLLAMIVSTVSATDNPALVPVGPNDIIISSSANPSIVGQNVTFTVHVYILYMDDLGGSYILPASSGTVELATPDDSRLIAGPVQVHDGVAIITTNRFTGDYSELAPGTYTMLVSYIDMGIGAHTHQHFITQTVIDRTIETPEFPTFMVPVITILCLLFVVGRKKNN